MAPKQLEAVRLSRTGDNLPVIISWVNSCGYHAINKGSGLLEIYGADNAISPNAVSPGDWIIRDTEGRLVPCKSDVFDETYDAERRKAFSARTEYILDSVDSRCARTLVVESERGDVRLTHVMHSRDYGSNTA